MSPTRREFLKSSAGALGGLVVAIYLPSAAGAGATDDPRTAMADSRPTYPPDAFVRIQPDGIVTIVMSKVEVGQGIFTSMAQLIAEELDCDWSMVRAEAAPVDPAYNHVLHWFQLTGGSDSIRSTYRQYREVGAGMRQMLIQAAASRWKVGAQACATERGFVSHPEHGRLAYGELAAEASKSSLRHIPALKSPKDFRVIGKPLGRLDCREKSDGSAVYGMDVRIPGMLYAVLARPPVRGARLVRFQDEAARAVPGVIDVVRAGDAIAVLGRNTYAAWKGRDALKPEWDTKGKDGFSSESLMAEFRKQENSGGDVVERRGDAVAALERAKERLTAEFEFPYLAHAAMEPLNCTIRYDGEECEIWTNHQAPTLGRDAAAKELGLAKEKVRIHNVFAGGSFGRRGNKDEDFTIEAARVVKEVKKPIKIVWTREDDMRGGYYRPMTFHRVELGFDQHGGLSGWKHLVVGQSPVAESIVESVTVKKGRDRGVFGGTGDTRYALPDFLCGIVRPTPNISTGWWRSVEGSHAAFVMETLIDELAERAKIDPFEMRRKLLAAQPKHLAVLELLKEKSGWERRKAARGRAFGLAVHEAYNTVVGHVVEVSLSSGRPKVHSVTSAVHCGQVVNPDGAKAQIEGGVIFGLSAALYGEVRIVDGRPVTANFDGYPVLRLPEAPRFDIHFVKSQDEPTGLGEPGVPPIAPALANALYRLTGRRTRRLPFSKEFEYS